MESIRESIISTLAEDNPMTVRQVFYALTTEGRDREDGGESTKSTVCRLLAEMRRLG